MASLKGTTGAAGGKRGGLVTSLLKARAQNKKSIRVTIVNAVGGESKSPSPPGASGSTAHRGRAPIKESRGGRARGRSSEHASSSESSQSTGRRSKSEQPPFKRGDTLVVKPVVRSRAVCLKRKLSSPSPPFPF